MRSQTKRLVTRELFRKCRPKFICVSHSVEQYVQRVLGKTSICSRVIYNSVDLCRFTPSGGSSSDPNDSFIIGTAARFAPEKGLDVLLKAYAEARQVLGERTQLQIAGSGSEFHNLRAMARSLGIQDRVKFRGAVDDMSEFYRGLSVFVLPSLHSEGFPLAIVEAMASGLPVIATDVGGSREAFKISGSGVVVPPANAGLLAAAIIDVAESRDVAGQMRAAARECAERFFGIETMVSRVIQFYKDLQTDRISSV